MGQEASLVELLEAKDAAQAAYKAACRAVHDSQALPASQRISLEIAKQKSCLATVHADNAFSAACMKEAAQ